MTSVGLGMPALPPPVLAPRRTTRQIKVGTVGVGSESPISVQSMTTTLTSDVNTTLQQIAELTASGCDIVRVACPSQDDADALRVRLLQLASGRGAVDVATPEAPQRVLVTTGRPHASASTTVFASGS